MSSGRQRASAAPHIGEPLYTAFVLSHSPCLPNFYNRATARNFVLVAIQTDAHAALFSGSGTNDSNRRSIAGASSAPKSVIRITAPRSELRDGRDRECWNSGSSRNTQMNVIIQKLNGLWHLIVGSCQIRTPFLDTQDRELVVTYARRVFPGAKIFEHD